jgi:hypothetical protein
LMLVFVAAASVGSLYRMICTAAAATAGW